MEAEFSRPQDRYISVGALRLRYWAEGSQGSPLVLVHGLGGYVETWWPNIMIYAREHRVFAFDLPGFGRSEKPGNWPYSIESFVQVIYDFMGVMGLENASLAGHSLGGALAMKFTLTHPRMVDRLVLVGSAGLGREVAAALRLASLPLVGELLTKPSLAGSRSFTESIVFNKSLITEPDVQLDYEISSQPGAQQAFLKTLRSFDSILGQNSRLYQPIIKNLPSMTQPTLVFWGRDDTVVPVKHADVARRIPNARLHIFDRCGHIPQYEHQQEFDQVMLSFLCD